VTSCRVVWYRVHGCGLTHADSAEAHRKRRRLAAAAQSAAWRNRQALRLQENSTSVSLAYRRGGLNGVRLAGWRAALTASSAHRAANMWRTLGASLRLFCGAYAKRKSANVIKTCGVAAAGDKRRASGASQNNGGTASIAVAALAPSGWHHSAPRMATASGGGAGGVAAACCATGAADIAAFSLNQWRIVRRRVSAASASRGASFWRRHAALAVIAASSRGAWHRAAELARFASMRMFDSLPAWRGEIARCVIPLIWHLAAALLHR